VGSTIDRYTARSITLPDGRLIWGRRPGHSGGNLLEHRLRDQLAQRVNGITEAVLPYGRADVLTADAVFEVEPAQAWRHAVRQALAYSAQCALPPAIALFGQTHRDDVLKVYLKLRDGRPPITLWWYSGSDWTRITSRAACLNQEAPEAATSTASC
jgi:hypothetical protein